MDSIAKDLKKKYFQLKDLGFGCDTLPNIMIWFSIPTFGNLIVNVKHVGTWNYQKYEEKELNAIFIQNFKQNSQMKEKRHRSINIGLDNEIKSISL